MNEFIDRAIGLFAPHICKGCGQTGTILCKRCIFDILRNIYSLCLLCETPLNAKSLSIRGNLCKECAQASPFAKIAVVGNRSGILKRLTDEYKFNSERGAASAIAVLLSKTVPDNFLTDTTVVPITTISKNIRFRGFDHMRLVGQELARRRRSPFAPNLLIRTNNLSQHSLATVSARRDNARESFAVNQRAKVPKKILLIDDIFTTGATVNSVANLLLASGAKDIRLAIVARQIGKSRK